MNCLTKSLLLLTTILGLGIPASAQINLFNQVPATLAQTSRIVTNPNYAQSATLIVTWAGITGSPSGCQFQVVIVDSQGNISNNGSPVAVAPANGTSPVAFTGTPNFPRLQVAYTCTTYPTAGTFTLDYSPSVSGGGGSSSVTSLPGNSSVSPGIWVTTTDALWNQLTMGFTGGSGATACCTVTNYTTFTNFRILQTNGTVYDAQTNGTAWSITNAGTNNAVCGTGQLFPVSGWLQNVTTLVSASTGGIVQPGQVFSNLYVLKAMPAGGSTSSCISTGITPGSAPGFNVLTGGPLSNFYPVSWQPGTIAGGASSQLPGQTAAYLITNPAAGANATFTPPTTNRVIVTAVHFQLATSNQAGNRTVCIFVNANYNGGIPIFESCASGIQPPSTTMTYDGLTATGAGSGGNALFQTIPLPANLVFPAGATFQISTLINGIQSNDQVSAFQVLAQTYQENN